MPFGYRAAWKLQALSGNFHPSISFWDFQGDSSGVGERTHLPKICFVSTRTWVQSSEPMLKLPDMKADTCNPNTGKSKSSIFLWLPGKHSNTFSEFHADMRTLSKIKYNGIWGRIANVDYRPLHICAHINKHLNTQTCSITYMSSHTQKCTHVCTLISIYIRRRFIRMS